MRAPQSLFAVVIFLFCFQSMLQAQEQMQDVVYLKNGSIIRGIIIEQVPNKSLKIKTKDGSVFVYNMDDIERITKEEPVGPAAASGSGLTSGGVMVRGAVGTDINLGLGVGGGIAYVWLPAGTPSSYEFGLDFFYHESDEETGTNLKERTKLMVFAGRANWLWNYSVSRSSVYFITGVGFAVASVEWSEFTPTATINDWDGSSAGNVINLGVGWSSPSGLGVRLETPLIFFYGVDQSSAFVPTVTFGLNHRF